MKQKLKAIDYNTNSVAHIGAILMAHNLTIEIDNHNVQIFTRGRYFYVDTFILGLYFY